MLPPLGKYLNPVELLFQDLKEHYIRPSYKHNGVNLTYRDLKDIIRRYFGNLSSTKLKGFYRKRANGKELYELGLLN